MSDQADAGSERLSNVIRTTQIIAGAILAGLAMMGAVLFAIGLQRGIQAPSLLTYVAGGVVLVGAVLRTALHGLVATSKLSELRRNLSEQADANDERVKGELAAAYQTGTIAGFAAIEGAGFFAWILYVVHPSWMGAVAGVFALVVMAVTFPSRGRMVDWIEQQQESLRLESPR